MLVVVDTSRELHRRRAACSPSSTWPPTRVVRTLDLGGQPDSIALTPDKTHAAIAIENQRDEEVTPAGGKKGDLPQLPGGFVQLVDLPRSDPRPDMGAAHAVDARPAAASSRASTPRRTPSPSTWPSTRPARPWRVTLQENNGVVARRRASRRRSPSVFSAGRVAVDRHRHRAGRRDQPDRLDPADPARARRGGVARRRRTSRPRTRATGRAARAAGRSSTRPPGAVVWDAGSTLERLAVRTGLHSETRAGEEGRRDRGPRGRDARRHAVRVRRLRAVELRRGVRRRATPLDPRFVQVLADDERARGHPAGAVARPAAGLERDRRRDQNVRSSVSVFGRGTAYAKRPARRSSRSSSRPTTPRATRSAGARSAR